MSAIERPPVPEPCPECGYPEATQHDCPGTSLVGERDGLGKFSNNVRVQQGAQTLSPMVVLREATESIVRSAYAYRTTKDPIMKESLRQALYRANEATQALIIEVETRIETDVRAQLEEK